MEYDKIAQAAYESCLREIMANQSSGSKPPETQAKVFTSGIVAAIQEYDRQRLEN